MKSFKFLIATTMLLIISCSNLGEQSQKDLKLYRGGNAFNTVLEAVLKEDKSFADLLDKAKDRESYSTDQISFARQKSQGAGPENFISIFYENVFQQIGMVTDSMERKELTELRELSETEFWTKMEENIELNRQIIELENELGQRIQKLKIKKTLDYMKKYQDDLTIDVVELTKEKDELTRLLASLEKLEQ